MRMEAELGLIGRRKKRELKEGEGRRGGREVVRRGEGGKESRWKNWRKRVEGFYNGALAASMCVTHEVPCKN